jgi:hypothetical protein
MARRARAPIAWLAAFAAASAVLAARNAYAYRPFDGTDADVASVGDFELELGPAHWYSQSGAHYAIAPATVLNLGFLPRWELVIDFQNFLSIDAPSRPPAAQLLDTDVLAKFVLVPGVLQERGTGPSVAVELGPLLPNINAAQGFGASLNAIVSQRWQGVTIHSDSWFQLTRGVSGFDWFEGIILEGPFGSPVRPVGEIFVERDFGAAVTTWSALVGAIWRAREGLDLDVGMREARVGDDAVTEIRLGFTWTLGLWEPEREGGHGRASLSRVARR